MKTKRIALFASYDWSMRHAMAEFMDFLDPVIKYQGEEYKIELSRVMSKPVRVGADLRVEADLIVDRTTHWSEYYRNWGYQAMNSGVQMVNSTYTFDNYNKHTTYDVMARAMHPVDRFPTTVLLPSFGPVTWEHYAKERWLEEQNSLMKNTKYGWDPKRKEVDLAAVKKDMADYDRYLPKGQRMRADFYPPVDFLRETMEKDFGNQYPVFLKKTDGGGGSDVYKINNLQELYERFDQTEGRSFHLQEAVLDYDIFIRCMAIGPQVLPMRFQPDAPHHEHYSPEKIRVDRQMFGRLENYVKFINSYHRWTYNSFESLIRKGEIFPIDFANGCPDSHFTSLHTHFPWLIVSLVKWLSFCVVSGKDMRIDMEHGKYLKVLNDPNISQEEKYNFCAASSEEYFETARFEEFCAENFKGIDEKMVAFYDRHFDEIIEHAIEWSDFPKTEHPRFFRYYKDMMDKNFRANAKDYLTTVLYTG